MKQFIVAQIVCFKCKRGDVPLRRVPDYEQDYACTDHIAERPAIQNSSQIPLKPRLSRADHKRIVEALNRQQERLDESET